MEHSKVELEQVEQAANLANSRESAIRDLADLELALVGGGFGDVHF